MDTTSGEGWSLTWAPLSGPSPAVSGHAVTQSPRQRECVAWVPRGGRGVVGRLTLGAGLHRVPGGPEEGGPRPDGTQVSRTHALLEAREPSEGTPEGTLTLTDLGSKFGSEVNGRMLAARVPTPLRPGDVVRFGARDARFRVARAPLPHLVSSGLSKEQLERAVLVCRTLGWTLSSAWSPGATHLLLPALKPTLRVLQALVAGQHLVHPAWLDAIHVQGALGLTCVADFLPPIVSTSPLLQGQHIAFGPDARRATLLAGQTLVFRDAELQDRLAPLVSGAGGSCALLSGSPVAGLRERMAQLALPPDARLLLMDDDPGSRDIQELCSL